MYKQLVTPNLDPVVYQYGEPLYDWMGWCLAVAWTAFGGKTTNPTAWSAWTNSVQYKHTDALPSGVYVPIWFSGYGGSGHVAIYKDGTVWSSPYTHKATMDKLSSIAEVERIYGVKYVGWSEDIGSVKVIEGTNGGSVVDEEARKSIDGLTRTVINMAADIKQLMDENKAQSEYIEGITRTVVALAEDFKNKGGELPVDLSTLRIVKAQ